LEVPDPAVGGHRDDRADGLARPPGDDLEADGVELGLEIVVGEREVEIAPGHHRVGLLHGPAHLELERYPAHRAGVVQDRVPALRGQGRALLVQHAEGERPGLGMGTRGDQQQARQGDEDFRQGSHGFVSYEAFQCRAKCRALQVSEVIVHRILLARSDWIRRF
jgi:hypothetical protein